MTMHSGIGSPNGVAHAPLSPFDVLTLGDAADYLKLSEAEVRTEVAEGRLVGQKVGSEWRFLRQKLIDWLSTPPPAPAKPRRSLADLPLPDISDDEYEAFRAVLEASRDEVDRATKSGKYAEDE
jgi:excisionase family DNA binding protein